MKHNERFLEFSGKAITFLSKDGVWWVAVKPICEALNVNYNRQFQNLKEDKILGQLFAEQQMVAADNKVRSMTCLPEKYIYGWLFSIQSNSEDLFNYKKECYDVLFNHFHGGIRSKKLSQKLENTAQIESLNKRLEEKMKADPDYTLVKDLEAENIKLGKEINQIDKEEVSIQLNLFREKYSQEN